MLQVIELQSIARIRTRIYIDGGYRSQAESNNVDCRMVSPSLA